MGPALLYLAMMTVNNHFDKCKRERFFMAGRTRNCEAPSIYVCSKKERKMRGASIASKKGLEESNTTFIVFLWVFFICNFIIGDI